MKDRFYVALTVPAEDLGNVMANIARLPHGEILEVKLEDNPVATQPAQVRRKSTKPRRHGECRKFVRSWVETLDPGTEFTFGEGARATKAAGFTDSGFVNALRVLMEGPDAIVEKVTKGRYQRVLPKSSLSTKPTPVAI